MAALIIRIEEHHQDVDPIHKSVGFSILQAYDGELAVGDCLLGLEPLLLRAVREAIDGVFGSPVGASDESLENARRKVNRFLN